MPGFKPKFKTEKPKSDSSGLDFLVLGIMFFAIISFIGGSAFFVFSPMKFLFDVRAFFAPFFEKNLWWLQIISVVLSLLFLYGTIYIIRKSGWVGSRWEYVLEFCGVDLYSRKCLKVGWKEAIKKLSSENKNDWKSAVIQADEVLNEMFKAGGYLGIRLDEKLDMITSEQLPSLEEIKNVHQIRNRLVKDKTFELTHEEAQKIVGIYEKALRELNLIKE